MFPRASVKDSSPKQILRNARDRVESADDCQEVNDQYKVYNDMSSTLYKVAETVRKDQKLVNP